MQDLFNSVAERAMGTQSSNSKGGKKITTPTDQKKNKKCC